MCCLQVTLHPKFIRSIRLGLAKILLAETHRIVKKYTENSNSACQHLAQQPLVAFNYLTLMAYPKGFRL